MDLLSFIKIKPGIPERTVFKHLKYDDGPNELANVPHKTLIACTARSGSSLLQVCLERYGLNVQEFFNVEGLAKQVAQSGEAKTIREYADYLARKATANGHFAAKGAYPAFLFLYYLGEAPALRTKWKVVFLRRRNIIRQAISMKIAAVTQQWTADMPARASVSIEDYSFDDIANYAEVVFAENQIWERIFGLLDLNPYRIFYEHFTTDIDVQTERVAKFIGIDTDAFPGAREQALRLKVQSTDINAEWERRFRKDMLKRTSPVLGQIKPL